MPSVFRAAIVGLALSQSLCPAARVAAAEYAPIMPLASRSLLLDITAAGERSVAAGERGHILFSDDQGGSWQQGKVPTTQMLTGVHFVNATRGWAVGHDGLILVSDDGGENWRVQHDGIAAQHQTNLALREKAHQQIRSLKLALENADEDASAALELQLEDAVMDLEDADLALEEAVFTSPLLDVWFQDESRGWAVGAFGSMLSTDDGGQHWISHSDRVDNPDEFHLNAIIGDGRGRVFIAGEGGVMYRSIDGGQSWEAITPFYEGSWFGTLYDAAHDTLLVFGLRGNLYLSRDFGDNWETVADDNKITLAGGSVSADGQVVLVGGVGTVLRSGDGGLSFRRSTLPDRLSLSSALESKGKLIVVGQGGARILQEEN